MNVEDLARLPLCEGFAEDELRVLAGVMTSHLFEANQTIFKKGSHAKGCHFVLGGEVVITVPGEAGSERVIARLQAGALVGEVALIDGGVRSASGHAGPSGAWLAGLERGHFESIFQAGNPFAYALLDAVAGRLVAKLRAATAEVTTAATR